MTDTDKLKRLTEAMVNNCPRGIKMDRELTEATGILILALIAENERLRAEKEGVAMQCEAVTKNCFKYLRERDEAVALLRPLSNMATVCGKGGDDSVYVGQSGIRLTFGDFRRAFAFLARIDAWE